MTCWILHGYFLPYTSFVEHIGYCITDYNKSYTDSLTRLYYPSKGPSYFHVKRFGGVVSERRKDSRINQIVTVCVLFINGVPSLLTQSDF